MTDNRRILLIEDDQLDVLTFKRAMRDLDITHPLIVAATGEAALQWLAENETNLPWLIIMDLNMPRMNGIELLTRLKAHPIWRRLPVIILTTSNQLQERQQCFDLSAAGFIVKPLEYSAFVEVVRIICNYWCINHVAV